MKDQPGQNGRPTPEVGSWNGVERALEQPPLFVDEEDLDILRLLWSQQGKKQTASYRRSVKTVDPTHKRHADMLIIQQLPRNNVYYST